MARPTGSLESGVVIREPVVEGVARSLISGHRPGSDHQNGPSAARASTRTASLARSARNAALSAGISAPKPR